MSELEHKETMQALTLPTMALRGITVFPSMLLHFDVGRQTSIKALDQAVELGSYLFLIPQKDLSVDDPELSDLYSIGTIAAVRQVLRLPGDNIRVMVEGIARARAIECWQDKPFFVMQVEQIPPAEKTTNSVRAEAVIRITYDLIQRYCELSPKTSSDVLLTVVDSKNPGYMADYMAQNLSIRGEDKQTILEELRPVRRLEKMNRILRREIQVLEIERDLETKVKEQVSQNQKDYYLREQLKAIQSELGDSGDGMDEIAEYEQKINAAKLPKEVDAKLRKELTRLSKQPYSSAEASVLRNYLDVCLELPWTVRTKERLNVEAARKVLDADHYGLDKVKERILEFLAVKQLAPDLRGQIICLVGPPGVGKTSIASSLAKAMNRKMARVSLGGIHDEAEIRGHRKTYIGAMPGRIIAAIQKAGSCKPLILLDEIDKLGADSRSDPSAALLEVLDAAQNSTFRDHFLELPFDLSDVVFITTANDLSTVSRPLLDRMEVIELSSYTDEEKLQIARRHLLPSEMKRHGLNGRSLRVTDGAIREIITGYTRVRRSPAPAGAGVCVPEGGHGAGDDRDKASHRQRGQPGALLGHPPLPSGEAGSHPSGGLGQRPGLDQCGRHPAGGGGERGAWLRQGGADRQPGGRDEGVLPLGHLLYPLPHQSAEHRPGVLSEQRYSHPFPRRRRAQGRPLRRRDHHHRHRLRSDQHAGEG